jgi:hypothetical protein
MPTMTDTVYMFHPSSGIVVETTYRSFVLTWEDQGWVLTTEDGAPGPPDISPGATITDALTLQGAPGSFYLDRSHHIGTQIASTISDFIEAVSDQVGAMFTGNTETGITATYDDTDNTIDLVVSGGGSGGTVSVSVESFGALCNGTTNDSAAWTAALATGKHVTMGPGISMVDPNTISLLDGQMITGSGRARSYIKTRSAGVLVKINGSDTATRRVYCTMMDITLDGAGLATTLLQMYHGHHHALYRCGFVNTTGKAVDAVELWDSQFFTCMTVDCIGADGATPAWHVRNASVNSATGFGGGDDNSNMLRWFGCTWESFKDGALWIEQGARTTQNPNHLYLDSCKMETVYKRGSILKVGAGVKHFFVNGLNVAGMALDSGATAGYGIEVNAAGDFQFRAITFTTGTATMTHGIYLNSNGDGVSVLDGFDFRGCATPPTTGCIGFAASVTPSIVLRSIFPAPSGTLIAGSPLSYGGDLTEGFYLAPTATTLTPDVLTMGVNVAMVLTTTNLTVNAPTNPVVGQRLRLIIIQSSGTARTLTLNSVFHKSTAWVLSTTLNTYNNIEFVYTGSVWMQVGGVTGIT